MHNPIALAALLAALLAAHPAAAAGRDIVEGLADVLAAEQFCALAYDQPAIERFVAEQVAADDLEFTGLLKSFVWVATEAQGEMTAATAHCTQIRRLARTYGFID